MDGRFGGCWCQKGNDKTHDETSSLINCWFGESIDPCDFIYVKIDNFKIMTSDTINQSEALQLLMADITYSAISEIAQLRSSEIDREDFTVKFHNVFYPLQLEHTLCASWDETLTSLAVLIMVHAEEISATMKMLLEAEYGVEATKNTEITIDTSQLSLH